MDNFTPPLTVLCQQLMATILDQPQKSQGICLSFTIHNKEFSDPFPKRDFM
ncbi:15843_t:CDS:2, partial [Funneliformis caledonium]